MSGLELMLTHRLGDGAAVFVDRCTDSLYVMQDDEDELHLYDGANDLQIRQQGDIQNPIPEKERIFIELSEATNYIRALSTFDHMVGYVLMIYDGTDWQKVTRIEADEGLQEIRDRINENGYREILETVPQYQKMLKYLEMTPEEIISDLKSLQVSNSTT